MESVIYFDKSIFKPRLMPHHGLMLRPIPVPMRLKGIKYLPQLRFLLLGQIDVP